jgi:hypothetical protein
MIEDGITGFILYTGRKNVKLSGGSSCRKSNNGRNACSRNGKTTSSGTVITETLNSTPRIAAGIAAIEERKPSSRLPSGMTGLMALWRSGAPNMNEAGVAKIIQTYYTFDGYWSKNDLKKFLNIVQNIRTRKNITKEKSNKLNVLNGRIRGFLPNNGSPSRSGLKRTLSNVNNGGNAGTTPNRRIVNARPPPPTNNSRQPTPPAPPTNNAAKRRANLSAYINNLQTRLLNKNEIKYNFKKNNWMKNLSSNNTNSRLKTIKEQLNGIYKIQQGQGQGQKRARNNSNGQGNKNNLAPRSLSG